MSGDLSNASRRRLLVIADEHGAAERLAPLTESQADLQFVRTATEALDALRSGEFDLILAGSSQLLPLTRSDRHQRAGAVLEGIAQGACIVRQGGELVWSNAAMRSYPSDVLEAVRAACAECLQQRRAAGADGVRRVWQRTLRVPPDFVFELSVSSLPGGLSDETEALGLFSDVSEMSRLRDKLDAVDAAGREIIALGMDANQALDVLERLGLLEEKLIRYCRDLLHFTHFTVLVLDPRTERLHFVVTGGFSQEAQSVELYARPEGNGISGYVAATGQSYICRDISADPRYLPGIAHAASSLTVPLRLIDAVVGVFNVESDRPAAFSDQDRQFAEILGRYIAVALHTLKLLAVERKDAAGQVTTDVTEGLMTPLDRIVAEVSRLLEEAAASDAGAAFRPRLETVLNQVDEAKRALLGVTQPKPIRGLAPDEAAPIEPLLAGKRVLIADDEEDIRESIAGLVSRSGALAVTARDGDDAIAILRTQSFDLVLSDIKMPHRSGYDVFAAAKAANPSTPVILITAFGYDPDHVIVRASQVGLSGVILKPYSTPKLMDLIRKALTPSAK